MGRKYGLECCSNGAEWPLLLEDVEGKRIEITLPEGVKINFASPVSLA